MNIRPYEKLIAWREAYRLCLRLHKLIESFPESQKFALVSQIIRSAASVPLNLAEGSARQTAKGRAHFYTIAIGSLEEIHCQLRISNGLGYISQEQFEELDTHVQRVSYLIHQLKNALKRTPLSR